MEETIYFFTIPCVNVNHEVFPLIFVLYKCVATTLTSKLGVKKATEQYH